MREWRSENMVLVQLKMAEVSSARMQIKLVTIALSHRISLNVTEWEKFLNVWQIFTFFWIRSVNFCRISLERSSSVDKNYIFIYQKQIIFRWVTAVWIVRRHIGIFSVSYLVRFNIIFNEKPLSFSWDFPII